MYDDVDGASHIEKIVSNPVAADDYARAIYPESKVDDNWYVLDEQKDKFVCCYIVNPEERTDYLRNYLVVEKYEVDADFTLPSSVGP